MSSARPSQHVPTEDETLDVQIAAQALESLKGTSFLNKITKESVRDSSGSCTRKRAHASLEDESYSEKNAPSNQPTPSTSQSSSSSEYVKKRTKWHSVIVTATSLASLSKDSRQRLRYCLHLLRLANDHLASKVTSLQDLIAEQEAVDMAQQIAANHVPLENNPTPPRRTTFADALGKLKKDIVTTVRKAVTVISTFAGNSLPEPARSHIRNYILQLPNRWALSLETPSVRSRRSSTVATTAVATAVPSGAMTPVNASQGTSTHNRQLGCRCLSTDMEVGSRVLSLAKESLDMLQHIMTIVRDTLDKAEMWCDRLGRPLVGDSSTVDRDSGEFDAVTLCEEEGVKNQEKVQGNEDREMEQK